MTTLPPKLAAALPAGTDANGLPDIAHQLAQDPSRQHVAVIVFDTSRLTTDTDTGDVTPTVRILRLEPITDPEAKQRLGDLATRAFNRRTGQTVLPLDLEDELRAAFGSVGEAPSDDDQG